jgi:hypothetical protein
MKKIFLIGAALISITIAGCKRMLDSSPNYEYSDENFWKTQNAADAALSACYSVLAQEGLYGGSATPLYEETVTPNAYNYANSAGWNAIAQGNQSASTGGILSLRWTQAYQGIGRCNIFLANVDRIPKMDESLKDRMKGEAHFLRALFYFNLENYWGDVPLVLGPPDKDKQTTLPRTPRVQVVDQMLKDLDSAETVLPWKYGSADLGRATKGAAMSLKAKILLFEASPLFNTNNDKTKWTDAAAAAMAVIDSASKTGYGLYPDYRGLFMPENENNQEVIFDVQFMYPKEATSFDVVDRQFNTNAPLLYLAQSYEMKNGLPITDPASGYDPNNPYAGRDPRLYATIVFPGDMYMGATVSNTRFAITGFGVEKYSVYDSSEASKDLQSLNQNQSYINYIVLRYADILLMYAEAQNEAVGADPSVYGAIDAVRERAGMPDIPEGLSQDAMREVIRHERQIEFACEGYYYNDIRRWKTAEKVMNGAIYTWDDKPIEVRKFDPAKDYWWPIQQAQLDLDPNLKQNPHY